MRCPLEHTALRHGERARCARLVSVSHSEQTCRAVLFTLVEWPLNGEVRRAADHEGERDEESTKDQLAGQAHEVKGAVKEKAGQVAGNSDLEARGAAERIAGTVQKKIGQVEEVFGK